MSATEQQEQQPQGGPAPPPKPSSVPEEKEENATVPPFPLKEDTGMEVEDQKLFSDEAFYLTSDPTIGILDENGKPVVVNVSKAIADNGGIIKDTPNEASIVIISPLKEIMLSDYASKRIFGSQYIEDSIILKKPLPKGSEYFHPLLSRCFEGSVVICDSSIDLITEKKLRQYVELMGGIFEGYSIPCEAKYFISISSLSLRFQVAAQRSMEIVGPEWIVDSFKVFKKLPTAKYVMPPLEGCIVGTLGFSAQSNKEIKQIVTSLGGLSTAQYVPRVEDPGTKPQAKRKPITPSYLESNTDSKTVPGPASKASNPKDVTPAKRGAEKNSNEEIDPKKPKSDGIGGNENEGEGECNSGDSK